MPAGARTDGDEVDEALSCWRQGDVSLEFNVFALLASAADGDEAEVYFVDVRGVVVVSQTCDIVREHTKRPYVEVSPLVEVDKADLEAVLAGRRPRYAYVPAVAGEGLVADLDRTMTVEKRLVASWERVSGLSSDEEARRFARALARKRSRFAFPDDFVEAVRPLQKRITSKHDKASMEGQALTALREIRVMATPSWDADDVDLFFWFIRERDADGALGPEQWDTLCEDWLARVQAQGRFSQPVGRVAELTDLSAEDYVVSDPLDLDHLSEGR